MQARPHIGRNILSVTVIALSLSTSGCTRLFLTVPGPAGSSPPCNPCLADRSTSAKLVAGTTSGDTISVDAGQRFQTIVGFGYALTDTAAYLIDQVPNDRGQRDSLMEQIFDPDKGIGVSWVRVIMGASDFTVVPRPWYSYRPSEADPFDIGRPRAGSPAGDLSHIIPLLRKSMTLSKGRISFFAEPHSAPAWMKTNADMWNLGGDGCVLGYCPGSVRDLRDEYVQYFVDFVRAYQAAGVPLQAVSVQNEPNNITDYPGGNFATADQLDFITRLKAAFRALDPRVAPQVWADLNTWEAAGIVSGSADPDAIDGIAYHCYYGPPAGLNEFHAAFPTKVMSETECTQDANAIWPKTIDLLIDNTKHSAGVVAGWNLALDPDGGPQATCTASSPGSAVDRVAAFDAAGSSSCTTHGSSQTAPIVVSGGSASFTREYYEMGQVSKFVHPGAVRIGSTELPSVMNVAFRNPDGSEVLVVHNRRTTALELAVNVDAQRHFEPVDIPPDGVATYTW